MGSHTVYPTCQCRAEYEARVFQTIGVQSYRLRIFGADGTDLYSQVIQVGTAAGASGAITPTAVRDWASIDIELSQFIEQVSILDIQGRVVNTPILEGNRLDLSALASGLYIVRVQTNASIWTQKITKQ
jgi:hypothetical protein